jgi:hypothetical protein
MMSGWYRHFAPLNCRKVSLVLLQGKPTPIEGTNICTGVAIFSVRKKIKQTANRV